MYEYVRNCGISQCVLLCAFSSFSNIVVRFIYILQLPPPMDPKVREYAATVPADKKGGDKMTLALNGHEISVTIPEKFTMSSGGTRPIKPGDKFKFTYGNRERVIASTLPTLPGTTVVEAKPMIYANVSHAYFAYHYNDQKGQTSMSHFVGRLLQACQTQLLQQACELGCNAVLGININVTTDSSGDRGNSKLVIVTMVGTPAVIMMSSSMPVVSADAVLLPDFVR